MKVEIGKSYRHVRNERIYTTHEILDNHTVFRVFDTENDKWTTPAIVEPDCALFNNLVPVNHPISEVTFWHKKVKLENKIQKITTKIEEFEKERSIVIEDLADLIYNKEKENSNIDENLLSEDNKELLNKCFIAYNVVKDELAVVFLNPLNKSMLIVSFNKFGEPDIEHELKKREWRIIAKYN